MSFKINLKNWILPYIILLALAIRLIYLNFNSVFLDEAIYIVLGKKILDGQLAEVAESISWVGGLPFFYPLLSAIFYNLGGILGSRALNVLLGTAAVYLIFQFTKRLKLLKNDNENRLAGLVAAGLLATSAIPIAFSRLAIYDILSFAIFLLGLVVLQKAAVIGKNWLFGASALVFFLAFLAKYFVLIYLPFLAIWTFYYFLKKKVFGGLFFYFLLPLGFLLLFYGGSNFASLKEFFLGQTSKGIAAMEILENFFNYTAFAYLLSLGGLIMLARRGKEIIFLLLASIWPLLVHMTFGEGLSVHQHSFLTLVFILPIAGAFLAKIIEKFRWIAVTLVGTVIAVNLWISVPKVQALESFWPNTTRATELMAARGSFGQRILSESGDVITLAVYDKGSEVFGPFVFSYKNKEGVEAYQEAILDGYFNFIELDETSFESNVEAILEKATIGVYLLIYEEGPVKVWELK